ncbi:hypothetical protein [Flavobacterium sp. NKUCC04_CG]|uniref:hypothetical protein n=1 Tax=Flavobacterium sp. NKUCC04_CG TaxID=2842121 RepID=UPI001C5B8A2B|nr:hypothetical protein [Flavobacterium sp. NKUCC04_CG]MBW3519684.1 hypothetical protein [Flavobacterium sp. NKUCC04_CG]
MKLKLLLFLAVPFFIACNSNVTKGGLKQDERAAEAVGGWLYYYSMNKNYDSIYNLMGDDYFAKSSKEKLKNYLLEKEAKLGEIKTFEIKDWQKNTSTDESNADAHYVLKYNVEYANGKSEEILYLSKEGKDLKITDYKVIAAGL